MNMNDYQDAALKTAFYPNIGHNVTYPTLGLCGEIGELAPMVIAGTTINQRMNVVKELGDVCWYCAVLLWECQIPLSDTGFATSDDIPCKTCDHPYELLDYYAWAVLYASQCAEIVKKHLRDDKFHSLTAPQNIAIRKAISGLLGMIATIAHFYDTTMDEVLTENLAKLRSRQERGVLSGTGNDR